MQDNRSTEKPKTWAMSPSRQGQEGFTLVEMLIVVTIIGLLAGIAFQNFTGVTGDAEIQAAQAQMNTFGSAIERYRLHTRKYPDSLQALVESTDPNWRGPYLRDKNGIPKDPWGKDYEYAVLEGGRSFTLKSTGSGQEIAY